MTDICLANADLSNPLSVCTLQILYELQSVQTSERIFTVTEESYNDIRAIINCYNMAETV